MSRKNYLFTSESVSEGHPDKVCDRVSDAVLDAFFAEDPHARVACETFATTNRLVVGGEVRGQSGAECAAGSGNRHDPTRHTSRYPPSTLRTAPVTKAEASDARNW